ncbi:hypothetical protein HMPREF9336_02507 [Segniliparus rugosus ATCC BAA-974]|uniref:Uncharacterized protein n=1 Tax=Segniliparus rugosus (strain ATCC BAA-974 / DSM 45345 / CCUG 50838 / CIP 108380 / JCM 13579 / CDC 945) TaxID=679197 RepID=E5XSN5_SEGRC|nr:hypothetical protein HMPREF9336_02507 [Segniliparus rugosus ATCC BAA-974]
MSCFVAPGPLQTSFFYPAETDGNIAWLQSMSINGQIGKGDDVVPLARFLVLPEPRWITAQTVYVNGGIISPRSTNDEGASAGAA